MFVTVASYKGGAGKTTTAVHLAAYLQRLAPTLLIDGDPNRSATRWAKRGSMPFTIADEKEGAYQARNFQHVVVDTEARPGVPILRCSQKDVTCSWSRPCPPRSTPMC
jgi:chromosome partitioning protein